MSDQHIRLILEDLGLSDKEVSIYLMLLQVGTAPASTLGERTDIQRSTAQYTCQQLAKKGVIAMIEKGNTYLYTPEPPEKLLLLLEQQKRDLDKKGEQVHRIIGELKGMMNPHAVLPKIRFFEGRDGVIEGYKTVLRSVGEKGTILSFLNLLVDDQDQHQLIQDLKPIEKAIEHKDVNYYMICPRSQAAIRLQAQDEPPRILTRLMEPAERLSAVDIVIFNDSIFGVTVEHNQIFGYIVENKSITQMHRLAFLSLWNRLEPKKA